MQDVVIIGGGVAGFGAAITLGSSERTPLKTLVLDSGNSDLLKSKLYNVPFVKQGTSGKEALEKLRKDALTFERVSFKEEEILRIDGTYPNFTIQSENSSYSAKFVILATGCHKLDIKLNGQAIPTTSHLLMPKPGKIQVEFQGRQELEEGIYVAGLLSGVTSMYAVALGSGVEAGCAVLSKVDGRVSIVHDFEGSRE